MNQQELEKTTEVKLKFENCSNNEKREKWRTFHQFNIEQIKVENSSFRKHGQKQTNDRYVVQTKCPMSFVQVPGQIAK